MSDNHVHVISKGCQRISVLQSRTLDLSLLNKTLWGLCPPSPDSEEQAVSHYAKLTFVSCKWDVRRTTSRVYMGRWVEVRRLHVIVLSLRSLARVWVSKLVTASSALEEGNIKRVLLCKWHFLYWAAPPSFLQIAPSLSHSGCTCSSHPSCTFFWQNSSSTFPRSTNLLSQTTITSPPLYEQRFRHSNPLPFHPHKLACGSVSLTPDKISSFDVLWHKLAISRARPDHQPLEGSLPLALLYPVTTTVFRHAHHITQSLSALLLFRRHLLHCLHPADCAYAALDFIHHQVSSPAAVDKNHEHYVSGCLLHSKVFPQSSFMRSAKSSTKAENTSASIIKLFSVLVSPARPVDLMPHYTSFADSFLRSIQPENLQNTSPNVYKHWAVWVFSILSAVWTSASVVLTASQRPEARWLSNCSNSSRT